MPRLDSPPSHIPRNQLAMSESTPGIWAKGVPNRSPELVIVSIVFLVISSLFFFTRLFWRWTQRMHGLDDVMAGCAYSILLIQTIFGGISAHYGFGKPLAIIKPTALDALKYFWLYQICYKLLGGFTKLTFCFLYLRIFSQRGFQRWVWVTIVVVSVGTLAFTLGTVFQCVPVERAWNRQIPGNCTSNMAFWFSHAAFNTFMDIVIYLIPIPHIRHLKLARGQKTGLISIFSFGAFVITASIVRMVMLRGSAETKDPSWGSFNALVWTEIEANTSVICCCLPALRVPLISAWHKIRHRNASLPGSEEDSAPPAKLHEHAWSGPQQHYAYAHHPHSPERPRTLKKSRDSRQTSDGSRSTSNAWYDRFLSTFSIYDRDGSPSSSRIDITKSDTSTSIRPDAGAIYKTTEMHVSMEDLPRRPGDAVLMGPTSTVEVMPDKPASA